MPTMTAAANAGAVRITGTDGATVVNVDLSGDVAVQFARDIVAKLLSVRAAALPGATVPMATVATAVATPAKRATVAQDFGAGSVELTAEDDAAVGGPAVVTLQLQPDDIQPWGLALAVIQSRAALEPDQQRQNQVALGLQHIVADNINPRSG